jgi:hypothetical protein
MRTSEYLTYNQSGGESGIRTRGTLVRYDALAKRCFRPLSHLSGLPTGKSKNRHRLS